MSQSLVYLLLFLALLLPVPGAILVRLLGARLGTRVLVGGATILFTLAIGSTLVLAQADVSTLRVGDLTLLLPAARRSEEFVLPPEALPEAIQPPDADPSDAGPPVLPTLTPRPSATPRSTATPRPSATRQPTATTEPTTEPTAEPTATVTPEPPTATSPPAAGPQRYTVQPGDTFRGIAERYGVSVADLLRANNLSAAQADSLRVGQELVIP